MGWDKNLTNDQMITTCDTISIKEGLVYEATYLILIDGHTLRIRATMH